MSQPSPVAGSFAIGCFDALKEQRIPDSQYHRVCAEMFARFRETKDPQTAQQVVFSCVARPNALEEMSELVPLAEVAAPWHHGNTRVLGAALYRAGRYAEAAERLEASARIYHPPLWELCFLGMTYQRLGQQPQARRCLEQALPGAGAAWSRRCLEQARRWIEEANRGAEDDLSGVQRHYDTWCERIESMIKGPATKG
jgi:tetratricopeptide (TPR) repeat protein